MSFEMLSFKLYSDFKSLLIMIQTGHFKAPRRRKTRLLSVFLLKLKDSSDVCVLGYFLLTKVAML